MEGNEDEWKKKEQTNERRKKNDVEIDRRMDPAVWDTHVPMKLRQRLTVRIHGSPAGADIDHGTWHAAAGICSGKGHSCLHN